MIGKALLEFILRKISYHFLVSGVDLTIDVAAGRWVRTEEVSTEAPITGETLIMTTEGMMVVMTAET